MKVAFRVDASNVIGSGHFMRCLTLARSLQSHHSEITFVCRFLPDHFRDVLREQGFKLCTLSTAEDAHPDNDLEHSAWLGVSQQQDSKDTIAVLEGVKYDWLVVDHYGIDYRWEQTLRDQCRSMLVIDDLADRVHDCDALVDQNLYPDPELRYQGKTPKHCKLFLGPRYAFLREEFLKLRPELTPRSGQVNRVLVYFGGVDADNHTAEAISALLNAGGKNLHVDVVIGASHPDRAGIQNSCRHNGFTCHVQTQRMAELMGNADLAIGAGGISTFERLYMRLPALLRPISDNQVEPLTYMSSQRLFDLYRDQKELEHKLAVIFANGVEPPPDCVADANKQLVSHMTGQFCGLQTPTPLDIRRTYKWLQSPQLREDFLVSEAPRLKSHIAYWRNSLSDPAQRCYSIYSFGRHVGNCGLKNIDAPNQRCELWIYLADDTVKGRGLGSHAVYALLTVARKELASRLVYLHVARENQAAVGLYRKTGFVECDDELLPPWQGREEHILRMEHTL